MNNDDENKEIHGKSGSSINKQENNIQFILPSLDGGSPKVLSLDEVSKLSKNMENMALIHEIALNPDFKLEPHEPNSALEKAVKEMMHKAFWNMLRNQLNSDPPCYDHALHLLKEIKEYFPLIIPERNQKILNIINETLDEKLIQQQVKNLSLDFGAYAKFIIDILAKSCAPVRDDQVAKLYEITDVVEVFKGILELMTLMKIDMANCILEFARNDLVKNAIDYEKIKFQENLKFQSECPSTKSWLERNIVRSNNIENDINYNESVFKAYIELLDWNHQNNYPEILEIDKKRIENLSLCAKKICFCSIICVLLSKVPMCSTEKLNEFSKELYVILDTPNFNWEDDEMKENIWVHIVNKFFKSTDLNDIISIKTQILENIRRGSAVSKLFWNRLITFICLTLKTKTTVPSPTGFEIYSKEMDMFAKSFRRVVMYNYSVYGEFYSKLLKDL